MRIGDHIYRLKNGAWKCTNDVYFEDMEYETPEGAALGGLSGHLKAIRAAWIEKGAPLSDEDVRAVVHDEDR